MSSSETAVSVRGLAKSYTIVHDQEKHSTLAETMLARLKNPLNRAKKETFWALKEVSFDIKKGEVVGIIGRNGAGKSTLLKILSRITEPTQGEIDLYGRVGSLLEVGTGFHPELTGRENVFLNGAILGMNKAEIRKQFDAIVDFAGVEQFLDTPVKRYSSGMYVRLAFAVAAHLSTEILIVDEVLAVGDAHFQSKCLGKMHDVAGAGRAVLFVSHAMPLILRLCNRAVLLESGSVRCDGSPEDVSNTYLRTNDGGAGSSTAWRRARGVRRGDDVASLAWARVCDPDGAHRSSYRTTESIIIEIGYERASTDVRTTANIHLINEAGITLFSSADFAFEYGVVPAIDGAVRARCTVPSHLLAEGQFHVLVAIVSYNPNVVHDIEHDALSFNVADDPSVVSVRGSYAGSSWPGVVRPQLRWDVEPENASVA